MANMTFGVNIIPKDNTVSLGTSQNKWKINGVDDPKLTDTTYSEATTSTAGLMSATDKSKLDGIAAGAQVNSVTGVKGNAESSYRTGNINLTPANIGALSATGTAVAATKATQDGDGNTISSTYLKLSGDATLTGNITINKSAESYVKLINSTTSCQLWLDNYYNTNSGSGEHGVWSSGYYSSNSGYTSDGKWMILRDSNGDVILNGNAATATKATQDGNGDTISSTYLKLSGGTMTGSIQQKYTDIDSYQADNNVSEIKTKTMILIKDKNNKGLVDLRGQFRPNGQITSYWYLENYNTSGERVASKGIAIYLDKAGELTYNFSDPANARSALAITPTNIGALPATGTAVNSEKLGSLSPNDFPRMFRASTSSYGAVVVTHPELNPGNRGRLFAYGDGNGNSWSASIIWGNSNGTHWVRSVMTNYNGSNGKVSFIDSTHFAIISSSWDTITILADHNIIDSVETATQTYSPGTDNHRVAINDQTITASEFIGPLTGNATTATTLKTARSINGTSFDGSAAITTANWGTARNITIKDASSTNAGTAVSVNGSAAVTLLLPSTIKASITGNCSGSATKIVDAGNSSKTLTIRYNGDGASATDWLPMHDNNGNLVPVSSTNLANKIRDKASGTWAITAATANSVSWANITNKPASYSIFNGGYEQTTKYYTNIGEYIWIDSGPLNYTIPAGRYFICASFYVHQSSGSGTVRVKFNQSSSYQLEEIISDGAEMNSSGIPVVITGCLTLPNVTRAQIILSANDMGCTITGFAHFSNRLTLIPIN